MSLNFKILCLSAYFDQLPNDFTLRTLLLSADFDLPPDDVTNNTLTFSTLFLSADSSPMMSPTTP
jgi:hypothetical protein